MNSKENSYFILELLDLVFKVTGKPFPVHLQRKLDVYSKQEDSNVTLNIRKAVMISINEYLVSKEVQKDDGSKIYEANKNELLKNYTERYFLRFVSQYTYTSVLEFINNKSNSPDVSYKNMVQLLEKLRAKGRFDDNSWRLLDECAITLVEEDKRRNNYQPLRKSTVEMNMIAEKGFVLKIIHCIFDLSCRDLPDYLQMEYDEYRLKSPNDPNLKNAVFVMLHEVGKRGRLLDSIEPLVLYYYNLCSLYFSEKYFIEFCVCCTRKALMEYAANDSKEKSPQKAYELLVYILHLAKEDGKFTSLDTMKDASTQIIEEDRDRIEHERLRRDFSADNSSETHQQSSDTQILIASGQQGTSNCRCCTLI